MQQDSTRIFISGAVIVALLIIVSLLAPFISPTDPLDQNLSAALSGPGEGSYLGTDSLGRDVLSRIIYGSRISLSVGIAVLALTLVLGTLLGTAAGYFGGALDSIIMRVADIFMSFPPLVLALIAMAFTGPGLVKLIIILVIMRWAQFARLVRGQVMAVKSEVYIDAARVSGARAISIIARHILPNCMSPIIVCGTMSIGAIIIDETALSFLGLGIQAPEASWGVMLADAKNYITTAPWLVIFPGLAVIVTVVGFNLLGDGLGYLLNPKQYERAGVGRGDFKGQ